VIDMHQLQQISFYHVITCNNTKVVISSDKDKNKASSTTSFKIYKKRFAVGKIVFHKVLLHKRGNIYQRAQR
jgi:hypothetical protein